MGNAEPRIGHRTVLFPDEVTCVNGLFLTTRVRTWLDLAQSLPLDDLVVIADHLVRVPRPNFENRYEPYATPFELGNMIARHPRKKGVRILRDALQLVRIGADSPPETQLRLAMVRAGLPEPRVNERIVDDMGNMLHPPDLSITEFRIAIEYEGQGHSLPDQIDRDIGRTERTLAAGWIEVRISKRHMAHGAKLAIDKIVSALIEQGWKYDDIAC
ncbi:hypothetical protein B0G38_001611 [Arthrobacter sp. VKM Ac-2550]|nr:hypothetical protein [Arthrobacter sp. VKM Ac-2550]